MLRNRLKAAEYRDRAAQASRLAGACILDRVRERHEAAAERWADLARSIERPVHVRAASLPMSGA